MTYNGWTNWKTWNTYNWLTSDEATYRYVTNMDSWMLKQYIEKESHRRRYSPDKIDISKINYDELAKALEED